MTAPRILRLPEVSAKIGLSRSAIYARLDKKSRYYDATFPEPIPLGHTPRPPVGWIETEIDAWVERLVRDARVGV